MIRLISLEKYEKSAKHGGSGDSVQLESAGGVLESSGEHRGPRSLDALGSLEHLGSLDIMCALERAKQTTYRDLLNLGATCSEHASIRLKKRR